jgi:tetratricopeptide (TPR) repeat protein
MKMLAKSIVTSAVLITYTALAVAQQSTHEGIRVGYNEFNMVIGDERYKSLGEYLPHVLTIHLVESPPKFVKDRRERSINSEMPNTAYNFWLSADFSVSNGQFSITPYLFDFKTGNYKYFDGYTCPMNGILDQMKIVGAEIGEYLKTSSTAVSHSRKLAVTCFGAASDENTFAEDLALGLAVNLSNPNVSLYPWGTLSKYCGTKSDPDQIISELNADALMSGDIRIVNDDIIVVPWIVIAGKRQVYLPEIIGNKNNYVALEQSLLSDINDFINNILKEDEWKIDSLDFYSADYRAYWNKGVKYFRRQELYMAAHMFTKALALSPRSDTVITNLALVRQWQERYPEAIKLFRQALVINPANVDALYSLGTTYYKAGNYRKSVEYLLQARNKKSTVEDIPWLIGRCYLLMGENKNAIAWYKEHLSSNPDDIFIRSELGEAYFNNNQHESSIGCFTAVLQKAPEDSVARSFMALIYLKKGSACFSKGKYEEAINYFSKAKSYATNEALYNYVIFANNKLGLFQESDRVIADGLRQGIFDSTSVFRMHAEYLMAEMQRASTIKDFLKFSQASIRKFKQHLTINPGDAGGFWLLGSVYISADSISSGVEALEKSIAADSSDVRVFLDLGEAYILNNTPRRVAPLFRRIPEHSPTDRDRVIMLYLMRVAGIVTGTVDEQAERDFRALADKNVEVSAWSYSGFERWLSTNRSLSPEQAEKIRSLTEEMKKFSR